MADYWKSLPRKFCEFCKCWITDNKPSVEFHEKGKRHQENVEKKISELRKKGQKDFEEKKKMDSDLRKMNEAALQAYQKDIQRDPTLARELKDHLPLMIPEPNSQETKTLKTKKKGTKLSSKTGSTSLGKKSVKSWFEGKSESGNSYYWNSETGASVWEPPPEGFVSLKEQKKNKALYSVHSGEGPSPKPEPYGQWISVEESRPEVLDLNLPDQKEVNEFKVATDSNEPKMTFRERTCSTLIDFKTAGDDDLVAFKKRKVNTSSRRNVRRRADDDD